MHDNLQPTYLDWAATAPQKPPINYNYQLGNPSSIHDLGRNQKSTLQNSREVIANLFNCSPEEIIFTSGATESNNLIMYAVLSKINNKSDSNFNREILLSALEHPSVSEPARQLKLMGFPVKTIPSNSNGLINLDKTNDQLSEKTNLVSITSINNETGAIQPISEVINLVKAYSTKIGHPIHFHTDAVQAFCKGINIPFFLSDSCAVSGHKIGSHTGVGALLIRSTANITPLSGGGNQENGFRSGTENVSGIFSFAKCAALSSRQSINNLHHAKSLYEQLYSEVEKIGIEIVPSARHSNPENYSPYIICLSAPTIPSEVIVRILSDNGIYVSRGSACSSSSKPSPVLMAMKTPIQIGKSAFRISTGWETTSNDIDKLINILTKHVLKLRSEI